MKLRVRGVQAAALFLGLVAYGGCGNSAPKLAVLIDTTTGKPVKSVKPKDAVGDIVASTTRMPDARPSELSFTLLPASATIEPGDDGIQMVVVPRTTQVLGGKSTGEIAWSIEPAGSLLVDADGYVRPLKAGMATVKATIGSEVTTATIDVKTEKLEDRPWDFVADVMPVLTRQGCNTGGCHGKAEGQNGFHLSLFGYDPEGDYQSLTRESTGRRLLPFDPENSLLLRKATGQIPHAGGQKIAPGSEVYRLLRDWIAAGAPETRGKVHGAITKVVVEPAEIRLPEPGTIQLRVVAHYADTHRRDITRLAQFKVNDDSAAEVLPRGKVRLLRRAEADLIVRYGSEVLSTRIATIINPDLKFDYASLPRRNVVDVELFKRLESLKVPPSPRSSDSAFLRRVMLDLTGQQPESARVKEFLRDPNPEKRARKVDELLKSDDFVSFWQIKYGDLLQISPARFNAGAGPYQSWLRRNLSENTAWDVMVRQLLTSLGDPTDRKEGGPVNYALDGADPKVAAEQTAQRFLGLRLRCSQCHDHPFDVWTQDDYFGLAAIFAKVNLRGPAPGAMVGRPKVTIDPKGVVEHLRTKKPAEMKLLDKQPVKVADGEDPRKALADWMTSKDNPYFARAAANWVWAQLFGRGLAEPADDLSRANPPVHPELLDALAKHFVDHNFDLRELIRTVATSEAYSLASTTVPGNEHDSRLFSHKIPRPLTAHQMADAVSQTTGVPLRFSLPGQRKAIEVNDPSVPSALLDVFGRCPRTVGCSSVATPSLSLRQALLLIGSPEIDGRVWNLNGYLATLMLDNPEPGDLVELLYFKSLCRPPSAEELSYWTSELKGASSYSEAAEDLFWALLNSREFAFNH